MKRAIPRHIGIIMDGNGRWAEMRGLPRFEGHKRGVERAREIIDAAGTVGVDAVSLYAFSIENWKRPEDEIKVIMGLLESTLKNQLESFMNGGVRFRVIGNRERLSPNIREIIELTEQATAANRRLTAQFAISYGGRDEIIRAVKRALRERLDPERLDDALFSDLLDTAGIPDPDLIIRTSGEQRISNFLTWQSAYAEFFFTDTLWPDFTPEEFLEAIHDFQMRDRRFGKVKGGVR
ncbi:MAG: di-trans,poly-cis-decaprenylcistransferase [Nitrospiraceae bacterium]|jgi:undecaprenyl diphosphate synthase|nr:di-trans,poly-cis-decaprenylcistransferase [Nitrospiraceae bacterium]